MNLSSLQSWARKRGYQTACGSMRTLVEARADIRQRHDRSELDERLYRKVLTRVVEEAVVPPDGSLVLVAVPRPAHRVGFLIDDGRFDALLPPAYVDYEKTTKMVRDDLSGAFAGTRIEPLVAPLKAIATRLGLVRYGRNNITYAQGIGSYMQLCGYVTGEAVTPEQTANMEPHLLEQCDECDHCMNACPTRAISKGRVLVRAHHCLTFANELPGEWPDWVSFRSHHCLIGCLACQRSCPANPPLPVVETDVCFSHDETRALVTGFDGGNESVQHGIQSKLDKLGQPMTATLLSRNLKALLYKQADKREMA